MSRTLTGLERPRDDRLLGGVCAALATRYEIDPTLVRLAFLVLTLASGLGAFIYVALWIALPTRGESEGSRFQQISREVWAVPQRLGLAWQQPGRPDRPRPLGRRWLAIGAIAGGAALLLWSFGLFSWVNGPRAIGLAAVAGGAAALFTLTRGGQS